MTADGSAGVDHIEWQLGRFRQEPERVAMVWQDRALDYGGLADRVEAWDERLAAAGVAPGDAVGIVADTSPASVACLLALARRACVLVPLAPESRDQHEAFCEIAELDHRIRAEDPAPDIERLGLRRDHPLLASLRTSGRAGLVLFSSGSTGKPKGIVHSLPELVRKFRVQRHSYRTLNFLLFDHIGGINTLFYTLANLGCTVIPRSRAVEAVCEAIARHGVELLPTSPSFLNLMLFGRAHERFDLGSLRLITYGTEVMPERTLEMAMAAFPQARFQQTYGLSELGILRSKSRDDGSLFVRIGGEDYETAVRDGTLRIRASSSMLGYLNAPSPFDVDGWFNTGDEVVEEDGYYRILGRRSDIINVGGQKVYPAEVENVVAELDGVVDVAVRGEDHLIMGQVVVATVQVADDAIRAQDLKRAIRRHARGRLQPFMVPTRVEVTLASPINHRFKKTRR